MLTALLMVAAVIVGFIGLLSLTEATSGVGLIAYACLLGIAARIAQARAQAIDASPAPAVTVPAPNAPVPQRVADRTIVIVMVAIVIAVITVLVAIYVKRP